MSDDLRGSILTEVSQLRTLQEEWRALAVERGNAFVTPEWYFAWLEHVGDGAEPYVVAVSDDRGGLVGVLPFVRSTVRGARTVRFPDEFGDVFHPVCVAALESNVAQAAARALAVDPSGWRAMVLNRAERGSRWIDELAGGSSRALRVVSNGTSPLPSIDLTEVTWDSYLASRSANFRQQIRRKLRSLERRHAVVFRRADSDPATVEGAIRSLRALHEQRWAGKGDSSFVDARAGRLLLDFALAASRLGWLRLWFLDVDGTAVAAWCGWRIGTRYSYYQAGFDPAWSADSVGLLLMARTIEAGIDEGASTYELLLGDEAFKRRFATGERQVESVVLAPSGSLSWASAVTLAALRRTGRRLPDGVKTPLQRAAQRYGLLASSAVGTLPPPPAEGAVVPVVRSIPA